MTGSATADHPERLAPVAFVRCLHDPVELVRIAAVPVVNGRRVIEVDDALDSSSTRMVYDTLSNLLSAAVDDERIPRNPAKGARLARAEVVPFVPLTADKVRSIAANTAEHVRAAVVVAAGTGLRQGKVFGLTIDRMDFMRRELRVDRQLWTASSGRPVLKAPKTATSYRTVALSSLVVDTLAIHVCAFGTGEDGLVFHVAGRPVVRAMASKYVRKAAAKAGLEGHGWHDLRHHHASVSCRPG